VIGGVGYSGVDRLRVGGTGEFSPQDPHLTGSLNADQYGSALHSDNGDGDILTDLDSLFLLPGQHEHGILLSA